MSRWVLRDMTTAETYTLPTNPKAMGTPTLPRHTTSLRVSPIDGKSRAFRTPTMAQPWTFTGRLRTKVEYDALVDWCGRSGRVRITDHFGRIHEVMPTGFEPTPVAKSGTGNPWLFDYTCNFMYFRRIA